MLVFFNHSSCHTLMSSNRSIKGETNSRDTTSDQFIRRKLSQTTPAINIMRILILLALLVSLASCQDQDKSPQNIPGAFISQLQTIQKQITSIAGVLSELNSQFSRVVQSSVRGVAGKKKRDDSAASGSNQPSVPSGLPQVPYGQNQTSGASGQGVPSVPSNPYSNSTGGRPQVYTAGMCILTLMNDMIQLD